RRPDPALDDFSRRLAKAPDVESLDTDRFKHGCGNPRKLGTGVHQCADNGSAVAWPRRVLDCDVDAKGAHAVGHITPGSCGDVTTIMRRGAKTREGFLFGKASDGERESRVCSWRSLDWVADSRPLE